MTSVAVFLALVVVAVNSADIQKLRTTPRGIQLADWTQYMGKWYLYAIKHSCSWSGGVKFTDWTHVNVMNNNKYPDFTILDQWRKDGSCSSTKAKSTPTSPGCYNVEDQVGDLWSGKVVIVDADRKLKHYVVRWGCVKYLGDLCADHFVSVKTRHPKPGKNVVDKIRRTLAELWDLSLQEMAMVSHNDPCDSTVPPPLRRL